MGKLGNLLMSRKFWAMAGGTILCVSQGNIPGAVAIIIAYIGATAAEDGMQALGAAKAAAILK